MIQNVSKSSKYQIVSPEFTYQKSYWNRSVPRESVHGKKRNIIVKNFKFVATLRIKKNFSDTTLYNRFVSDYFFFFVIKRSYSRERLFLYCYTLYHVFVFESIRISDCNSVCRYNVCQTSSVRLMVFVQKVIEKKKLINRWKNSFGKPRRLTHRDTNRRRFSIVENENNNTNYSRSDTHSTMYFDVHVFDRFETDGFYTQRASKSRGRQYCFPAFFRRFFEHRVVKNTHTPYRNR